MHEGVPPRILPIVMFEKMLSFYTRYFALWVILGGLAAYFWPGPLASLDRRSVNSVFALTMFGIGAVLQAEDFRRILHRPGIVAIGTITQYSLMPLVAYAIAQGFRLDPQIAVGLILTVCAPGAMSSSVVSYIAKADLAYSVSLTTVSTLIAPLATPGLTYLLAGSLLKVPVRGMLIDVILLVILPLFLGFAVRHLFAKRVETVAAVFPAISVTFIVLVCSRTIAANRDSLLSVTGILLGIGVLMNVLGLIGGYGIAWLTRMDIPQRRSLAIEGGMQNAGLGAVLASEHFSDQAAMPAAIFVFICIITASLLAAYWQRAGRRTALRIATE
ncbi:MAG: bile acid:sodium symporter family protein [Planctomycetes bacterium]|nr:bile acid:sodium symporter family protein [Planctomycetota bacterium]